MNVCQFFITCKRTNNANNTTHCVKLGKKRRKSSKRNYYIFSSSVTTKAIIVTHYDSFKKNLLIMAWRRIQSKKLLKFACGVLRTWYSQSNLGFRRWGPAGISEVKYCRFSKAQIASAALCSHKDPMAADFIPPGIEKLQ